MTEKAWRGTATSNGPCLGAQRRKECLSPEHVAAVGSQQAAVHCSGKMSGKRHCGGSLGVPCRTRSKEDRAQRGPLHVSCEGLAAAFAGSGGSDHVAACAILEEADPVSSKFIWTLQMPGELLPWRKLLQVQSAMA